MRDMTGTSWKRRGSSVVFHKALLAPLLATTAPLPLRAALQWMRSWPEHPPGGDTVLVAGLEACLDMLEPSAAENFVRSRVHPFIVGFQERWDQVGLVFGFACPPQRFQLDADESVLFTYPHRQPMRLSDSLWSGAAHNELVRLLGTADGRNVTSGYHVQRIS